MLVFFLVEVGYKFLGRYYVRVFDGFMFSFYRYLEEGVWLVYRWLLVRRFYRFLVMYREVFSVYFSEICVSRVLGSESRANLA